MIRPSAVRPQLTRAFLFVVAIVLPAAVLVFLTWRLLSLDRELSAKRKSDEFARLAERARASLALKAEQLRRRSLTEVSRSQEIVAVGRIERDQIVFDWEATAASAQAARELAIAPFADVVRAGEDFEYHGQLVDALSIYVRALASATTPVQKASASLHLARAAAKAADSQRSLAAYQRMLQAPINLVDDQDVPYAMYAARAIVKDDPQAVTATVERILAAAPSPPVLFMIADVCRESTCPPAMRDRLASQLADANQLLALRDALRLVPHSDPAEPQWSSVGTPPLAWLASVINDGGVDRLVVLRASAILAALPDGLNVVADAASTLAPVFPGIGVSLSPQRAAQIDGESRARRPLFIAALITVLAIAVSGAYLFWRDVQRDVALAQLRSQFVSSVSHELKTPLTAIRVSAETLLDRSAASDAAQRDYLDTIVNESDRLTRLLDNILDFASIESEKKAYRFAAASIADVVASAVRAMEYPLAQQQFQLTVDVDDALPPLTIDADAVQQAVLNLLSNAMKYSGDNRRIDLSVRRDGHDVVIAVADHGIGIAAEEHGRIFQQFYRVRSDETSRIPGTGLGLTLVQHVAQIHGGRVTLTSAPGAGSTFALRLPCSATGVS